MKLKTHQATAKRIKVSGKKGKNKTLITKKAGQDHFNARERGNTTRNKRRNETVAKTEVRNIRRQMPYN